MKWQDYYDRFYDWAESTQISRISSITNFTSTDEIVEIAENLDEKGACKLINKALSQGVYFNVAQIIEVCEYLNKETTANLIKQCTEPFTAEQIECITDNTLLWEDEIVKLLRCDAPVDLDEEELEDEFEMEMQRNIAKPKKLGFFATIGLGLLGADILDEILENDNDDF